MRSALLTVLLVACASDRSGEAVRPAAVGVTPVASAAPTSPARARPTRCAAQPSTVYGQEEVVFVVDGEGSASATADYELRDERGRSVSKGSLAVPGQLKPPGLVSGDFELIVGDAALRCVVTVNRELPRASQMTR